MATDPSGSMDDKPRSKTGPVYGDGVTDLEVVLEELTAEDTPDTVLIILIADGQEEV